MSGLGPISSFVAIAGLLTAGIAQADAVGELDDAVARMQYAFHTADARGVEEALHIVEKLELPASMKGIGEYFTAYGRWKLAELHTDEVAAGQRTARSAVSQEAAACARAAAAASKADARLAEAFALEAICTSMASRAPGVLSLGGCAKHRGLRTAKELAPTNPRVLFIEAQCTADLDETVSPADLEGLRKLVRAFETAPPSRPGMPDWGQAESLLMLGQAHLERGDSVAARDFIERALVIAPDYRKAREALEKSAARPR